MKLAALIIILCLAGCGRYSAVQGQGASSGSGGGAREELSSGEGYAAVEESNTEAKPVETPPASSPEDDSAAYTRLRKEAALAASSLDDFSLAAQVLMSGVDGRGSLSEAMKAMLREIPPGGVMLFRYNLDSDKDDAASFIKECSDCIASACGVAPFVAVDHEGGLVHRFGPGVEKLPPASSFWDKAQSSGWEAALASVEASARVSAEEIRALGITMNFAPVAEVLNGENDPFLGSRSYGPDPRFVKEAASAFIRGMDAAGIACAVKHFPGNTGKDPHYGPAALEYESAALDSLVKPFADIISELRPPALMVSHVLVPALDSFRIASLSPIVMGTWLRGKLKFNGIIISDDFSMAAAGDTAPEEAAVEALAAGADMVMVWPSTARGVHGAIIRALKEKRLSRERLLDAATHILTEKLRYNIAAHLDKGGKTD